MNACLDFFEEGHGDQTAARLQAMSNPAQWELLQASRFSPGVVSNEESLIRLVFHPIHVDTETGELKPSVVSDASSWGCSVQREKHCPLDKALEIGKEIANAKTANAPGSTR